MPIMIMAVAALAIFLVMGLMLMSATVAEHRARRSLESSGPAAGTAGGGTAGKRADQAAEKPKARAAHA